MTEQETFNEWVKQLEPNMAVPMYPKALLLDFMKKSFFAGLKQHEHDYLVKTNDLKANCDLAIEGRDIKIKELTERLEDLQEQNSGMFNTIALQEQQIEKMKNCGNCKYGYCGGSSISIDKDGNRTFHNWNEEKQAYCDIGKNGKYQCWEIKE